jgi:hypothetical protein
LIHLISAEVKASCLIPAYEEDKGISHKLLINIYGQLLSIGGEKANNAFCVQYKQEFNKHFELVLIQQNQSLEKWTQAIVIKAIKAPILPIEEGVIPKGYEVKRIFKERKMICKRNCGIHCKAQLLKESEDYAEFTELCGKNFNQDNGKFGEQSYHILHKKSGDTFMVFHVKKAEPFDVNNFKVNNNDIAIWKSLIDQNIKFLTPSDEDAKLHENMLFKKEKTRKNKKNNTHTHIVLGTKVNKKSLV